MVYPHSYRTEHSETRTTNSVYGEYLAAQKSKKIPVQPDLLKIIQYIDSHRTRFLKELSDVVEIKSISGNLECRGELKKMIDFTENWLFQHGLKHERFNIGFQEIEGKKVRLPVIILASLGQDTSKKTVCVYVHLDVKETDESKWGTDPWKVTVLGNKIYGCGVAQGKGTLMQWFHMIEAFQNSKMDLPVNLKFIIEGMYHYKSAGLGEFLALRKQDFLVNIDHYVVCDSEWIGEKHPCIIYGTVGTLHFDITIEKVEGSETDPRDDMVNIFKEVLDKDEHILIPHFEDIVLQVTPEEEKMYEVIHDFNIEDVRDSLPDFKKKWDKVKLLMHCWRLPSFWIGETEECNCNDKNDTVKRHFIVKLVPRQIVDRCTNITTNFIQNIAPKKLNIQNKVTVDPMPDLTTRYWFENVAGKPYQAARRACIQVYKEDPSMIREDRARVLIAILDRVLEKTILYLPLVSRGSNAGTIDENITTRNFYESTKLLAAYLFQIAK